MDERSQQGQALVYVIALLAAMALMAAYTHNAFTLANERTRLQNTADAVAYSVATVEARDLNFKAYTNRAMIANQVAIAQMVGLMSWSRWLETTSQNLATVTSIIPYVNAATRTLAQASRTTRSALEQALPIAVEVIQTNVQALSWAQRAHHLAAVLMATQIVGEVVDANDSDVDRSITLSNAVLLGEYLRQREQFTGRFSAAQVRRGRRGSDTYREHFARMEEFRKAVMNSRDGFSRDRTYRFGPRISLPWMSLEMRRAGSTDLAGEDRRHAYGSWIAMDTLSLHKRERDCGTFDTSWCDWKEVQEIGWGAAKNARGDEQVRFNRYTRRDDLGGSWDINRRASRNAARSFQNSREVEVRDYVGLQDFYDLSLDGLMIKAPGIRVLLAKPQDRLRTAHRAGYNAGGMNLEENAQLPSARLTSFAAAEPYFARINDAGSDTRNYRRADGLREYANLYNPYWQARLRPLDAQEKRQLQLAAGLGI